MVDSLSRGVEPHGRVEYCCKHSVRVGMGGMRTNGDLRDVFVGIHFFQAMRVECKRCVFLDAGHVLHTSSRAGYYHIASQPAENRPYSETCF